MYWFLKCLKRHYADFKGRARRKEYWMYILFYAIGAFIVTLAAGLIKFPLLASLYSLALLVPTLAVAVRRLHDIGKSGWWLLIGLVPVAGGIWLLVLLCLDSQQGNNAWGANPKA